MKEKKLEVILVGLLLLSLGCAAVSSRIKKQIVEGGVTVAVTWGECEAPQAVREDLTALLEKLPVGPVPTGPMAEAFCRPAVAPVVSYLVEKPVPARWKCKLTFAKAAVTEALVTECLKIKL